MKRFFYSVLAAATMLFATTSCSQDEEIVSGGTTQSGTTQKVTFKVEMPGEGVASRAIADGVNVGGGNQADKLIWALYEKGKDANRLDFGLVEGTLNQDTKKHEFTADISMVKGLTYNVLFFAYDADGCVFQLNTEDPDLTALKLKSDLEANVEGYDAFVKCHEHTVKSGNEVTTVTLKRPFAQINAATTVEDLDRAKKLQAVVTKSELVIKNVPTQYNVLTGEATENADLTYKASPILTHYPAVTEGHPNEDITVDNVGYKYLAMAYVLAGETATSDASTHEASFNFYRGTNGDDLMRNIDIINLPIQRNHRTNVIGDLLTETESFKIVIDEQFDEPDHNINGAEEDATTTTVATLAELQAALDAIKENSSTIIKLSAKIEGNATVKEIKNAEVVIDGCSNVFDGQIKIQGNSTTENSTLLIKNINFETSTASQEFIWSADSQNGSVWRYAENVTIKDCTFKANENSAAIHTAVGVKFQQAYNIKVINCTATNMHTLLQAESCGSNVSVEGSKVYNGKNGVSFNNTMYASISDTYINAVGSGSYGIRHKGEVDNYSLNVKNCEVNAFVPVLVRNMTGTGYNLTLEGANSLTVNSTNIYQIVLSNTDYDGTQALAEPTGSYTVTGVENFNVYPISTTLNVSSSEQLSAAISAGYAVELTQDITTGIDFSAESTDINLGGNTLTLTSSNHEVGGNISVKEGTVNVEKGYFDVRPSTTNSTQVFEGVVFKNNVLKKTNGTSTNHVISAFESCPVVADAVMKYTFKNCTFENANAVFEAMSGYGVCTIEAVFENCTFNLFGNSSAIDIVNYITANITIKSCTFNITATSSSVGIIDSMNGSTVNVTFEGTNVLNGTAAVATDSSVAGTVDEVRIHGIPAVKVKATSWAIDTLQGEDTITCTGIATK